MVILRSYREIWREALMDAAGPEQETRLPVRRIGARDGVYVIIGDRHEEAAEYMAEQLSTGLSLAQEIALGSEVEEMFNVALCIDYLPSEDKK